MKVTIDTLLCLTDNHTVGLYVSTDDFESPIDERSMVDLVEEYCNLFVLPDETHVISSDCYDLVGDLKIELQRALDMINQYVDATTLDILKHSENTDES